jgi:putative DNA methylase
MNKKLIEVALPLDAINKASAREKSIRHGHPSTLHLWWARRPLAAARAVIFAQMVDDPSEYTDVLLADPDTRRKAQQELKKRLKLWEEHAKSGEDEPPRPTLEEAAADLERERLFRIIEDLVQWENTTNETVLQRARDEIWQSWRRTCAENADHPRAKELFDRHKLPAFHDPFAGGGSIPLEAQRLGLEAHASDLNPVAVLINKAMIEIPPKFAGKPPVNPDVRRNARLFQKEWKGAEGLAEDVRYYGKWMRDEAEKRIGHLYPKVEITAEMAKERPDLKPYVGQKLTVIAWLWARTVKSPNPAFTHVDVPLAASFTLATKPGKEAYVEPVVEGDSYRFTIRVGKPVNGETTKSGTKMSRGASFRCLLSGVPLDYEYIGNESRAGRMGARLMAIVTEGERSRIYLPPNATNESLAMRVNWSWRPESEMPNDRRWFSPPLYGMKKYGDIFTPRQLAALTTFSDLVHEAQKRVKDDTLAAGSHDDDGSVNTYADSIAVILSFAVDRIANYCSSLCTWHSGVKYETVTSTFGRQAVPMSWDFAESNPLSSSSGNWSGGIDWLARVLDLLPATLLGKAVQQDARSSSIAQDKVISTDPPYYDNIGYADLSEFFYIWLRRALRSTYPQLFDTVSVPKAEELVAVPYRHGSKEKAEAFFLKGMTDAMLRLAKQAHTAFPVTIYYAFKQSENESNTGTASTGWETFLDALIRAGFSINGTWPIRTEYTGNLKKNVGSLASSIVLVCRKSAVDARTAPRREFVTALKAELPAALVHLQRGNIAPVDLAQAAIGPGMAVYTRFAKVLNAQGQPISVREALTLINQVLDEVLTEQESDFDADSRWAMAWFEYAGFAEGEYGVAETLSKAKNTSVSGLVEAGFLASSRGKVRLLKPDELPADWDPTTDHRLTAWETVHQLIRALEKGGEGAAAFLVGKLGAKAETARELCYRLYAICERKKRAAEALAYNGLVQSWPEITRLAREGGKPRQEQTTMFEGEEE